MKLTRHLSDAEIISILITGAEWSSMAGLAGFASGTEFRQHCIARRLRRKIKGSVVIVIADPT